MSLDIGSKHVSDLLRELLRQTRRLLVLGEGACRTKG
jgi:hypothetical protein